MVHRGRGGHYVSSLLRCGSIWACPVCAPAVRWRREQGLASAIRRLQAERDVSVRLATLTVPHAVGDQLADLLSGLARAWHRLCSGRSWMDGQAQHGIVGWLRSVDITVSPRSGWHPHLHVLVVLDAGRPTRDEELAQWLGERWRPACVAAGLRAPSRRRGVDVRDVGGSSAGYVLGIVTETVRSDLKAGRNGSFAPLQLLDLAGTPSEAWARGRFRAYERAVHGRHAMASSLSLRPWLTALPVADGSDEDCPDPVSGTHEGDAVVALLSPGQWRALQLARPAWSTCSGCLMLAWESELTSSSGRLTLASRPGWRREPTHRRPAFAFRALPRLRPRGGGRPGRGRCSG